mmetsp:Transcript_142753/g.397644  ORF Transcript_142753/g.397644 Transcript_142753/m.397644 type:complete len:333 (+) Transcript_142753:874-1872(+)
MRLFCSRTSIRCRCCSSLCIWRRFCSSSRRACTWLMRISISISLFSPSILRSSAICWFFSLILSTFSLKSADLSLLNASFSVMNLSIRSSSANRARAWEICFSRKSSSSLARMSALCACLSSSLCFALLPASWNCFCEASRRCRRLFSSAWSCSSFLSWSSFSLTRALCCRSWPLRSLSRRLASFSKRDSSMERNCPLWTPGTSPFFAFWAITLARSASTCASLSFRRFSWWSYLNCTFSLRSPGLANESGVLYCRSSRTRPSLRQASRVRGVSSTFCCWRDSISARRFRVARAPPVSAIASSALPSPILLLQRPSSGSAANVATRKGGAGH